MTLTETQKRLMRWLRKQPNQMGQIAGNGQAPYLQSARALVRKGLLIEWRTSQFATTDEGRNIDIE